MSQQSQSRQSRPKMWQFSIADLLLVITLAAVTCGAFRLNFETGLLAVHLAILVAIATLRTRAAVRHHQELWDILNRSLAYRRNETISLATQSFGVGLGTLFFFYVGSGIAMVVGIIGMDLLAYIRNVAIQLILSIVLLVLIFGSGLLFSIWWLRLTWPRSFFTLTASPSAKSD